MIVNNSYLTHGQRFVIFSNVMQRLLSLFIGETALIWILHRLVLVYPVAWHDLDRWLQFTPADEIVMASIRYLALACAYWLLASTSLYVIGLLAGLPSLIQSVEWATLPIVRSVATRAVAASLAATTAAPAFLLIAPPIETAPTAAIYVSVTSTTDGDQPLNATTEDDGSHHAPDVVIPVSDGGLFLPPGATVSTPQPATDSDEADDVSPDATATATAEAASVATPRPAIAEPPANLQPASQPANATSVSSASINPSTHEVVRGDNLWDISASHLAANTGNSNLSDADIAPYWALVVELNRHTIASGNPDHITAGEIIQLPAIGTR